MRCLGLAACLLATPALAQQQILTDGYDALAAVQTSAGVTSCTGLMVAVDEVLIHERCLLSDGVAVDAVSVLTGLNRGHAGDLIDQKPFPRSLGISVRDHAPEILRLKVESPVQDDRQKSIISLADPRPELAIGNQVGVLHFSGLDEQTYTLCNVTDLRGSEGQIDCPLPASGLSAPVLVDETPVALISATDIAGGATFTLLQDPSETDADPRLLDARIFASVDVLNLCDVDIHQGLFFLETDGVTWTDLARRIPAQSRVFLPVATIGDSVFSYARSDDGRIVWDGDDLHVMINGSALAMRQLMVPPAGGDLVLTYGCENE